MKTKPLRKHRNKKTGKLVWYGYSAVGGDGFPEVHRWKETANAYLRDNRKVVRVRIEEL